MISDNNVAKEFTIRDSKALTSSNIRVIKSPVFFVEKKVPDNFDILFRSISFSSKFILFPSLT